MMKLFYKEKIGNKRILHILGVKFSYKKFRGLPLFLKQDKKSEIEFYLIDAFEIYHFLPIYNALLKEGIRAKIVAEPCEINTSGKWFDYKTAIKILKENKIDYCTKANPNTKIAITTQTADLLSKYKNKKAVLAYGVGLNKNNFGLTEATCKDCDLRFVHGSFQKQILSNYMPENNIHIIGYPKHDDFFKNKPEKENILNELNIKTNKPIIVYFPTWDEDSTVQTFGDEINKLRNKYFIITKAHHCTFRLPDKKEDLKKLYEISDIVLEGNFPFEKAATMADIALIDAKSGALTEVQFLNSDAKSIALSVKDNLQEYFCTELFKFTKVINNPKQLEDGIINDNFTPEIKITDFYSSKYKDDAQTACSILLKELI